MREGALPIHSLPLVIRMSRARFAILGLLAVFMYVAGSRHLGPSNDWQYFTWASGVLFGQEREALTIGTFTAEATGRGGLHLYAEHPFIQIGPLALAAAALLGFVPGDSLAVAGAVVQALGVLSIWCIERCIRVRGPRSDLAVLVGGALVTVVWGSLTLYHHLDDALALTCLAFAALAVIRGRWLVVGGLAGVAAAMKPWAIVLVACVAAAPSARTRISGLAAAGSVVVSSWGPFVLADPRTWQLGEYHLDAAPSSAMSALGLSDIAASAALRPAQFLAGLAFAYVLVRRGRWQVAILTAFSLRLLLDPNVYAYYGAALVLAAFLVDVTARRTALPLLTSVAALSWLCVSSLDDPVVTGWMRCGTYVTLPLLAWALLPNRPVHSHNAPAGAVARRHLSAAAPS